MGWFVKKDKSDFKAFIRALGNGLPDYLKEMKMIFARVMVSEREESEEYPGFQSFGVTYPGDLIDKLWGHRESYLLSEITIRKKWGGLRKIEIMVVDGWFQGIKIEGGDYRPSRYKLDSIDSSNIILTTIKKKEKQNSAK